MALSSALGCTQTICPILILFPGRKIVKQFHLLLMGLKAKERTLRGVRAVMARVYCDHWLPSDSNVTSAF